MRLHVYYFGCDFLNCYHHLYCGEIKYNVSPAVSSGLPQVSLVYQGIEMIQPGRLSLTVDQIRRSRSVKLLKSFPRLNPFYALINKRHLRTAGGHSGRNVVFQFTAIKWRQKSEKSRLKLFSIAFFIEYFSILIFFVFFSLYLLIPPFLFIFFCLFLS